MESRFYVDGWFKTLVLSLYFSLLTGLSRRDGFAGDWHLRQTVCRPENCSLIPTHNGPDSAYLSTLVGTKCALVSAEGLKRGCFSLLG
jgi:hypothetical protein